MVKVVNTAMQKWEKEIVHSGQEDCRLELHEHLSSLTLDVISAAAFGGAFRDDPALHDLIYRKFSDTLSLIFQRASSGISLFPILRDFPFPSKQKIVESARILASTVLQVVSDRSEGKSQAMIDVDLLDLLLASRLNANGEEKMTLRQVCDETLTFVLAGNEVNSFANDCMMVDGRQHSYLVFL